jgi:ABC-type multidrug transport system fused ATPase/permease subunit
MRADRFVAQLPKGYAEAVGEEGKRLSEGQRQLLGFSRAFARNPSLVILDEATSNIDSETEHLIGEGIARLLKNRTNFPKVLRAWEWPLSAAASGSTSPGPGC